MERLISDPIYDLWLRMFVRPMFDDLQFVTDWDEAAALANPDPERFALYLLDEKGRWIETS